VTPLLHHYTNTPPKVVQVIEIMEFGFTGENFFLHTRLQWQPPAGSCVAAYAVSRTLSRHAVNNNLSDGRCLRSSWVLNSVTWLITGENSECFNKVPSSVCLASLLYRVCRLHSVMSLILSCGTNQVSLCSNWSTKGLSIPANTRQLFYQATKLPKTATYCCQKRRLWQVLRQCCRFGQRFVAVWQQFVAVFGNNLLPGVDRP